MTRISKSAIPPKNHILLQLPERERAHVLAAADRVRLPVRHTFARAGDAIASAYFPDNGILALVSEMTTGHQLAVAAIGAEGVIGLGALFSVAHHPHRIVVLVETEGHRLSATQFRRVFEQSEALRRATLMHIGHTMSELTTAAVCHRVHSHRQRLARWLLMIADSAGQPWLRVTHETLAQLVGGPRHAVTVALKDLRGRGAIAHGRGGIEVVSRSTLIAQACECYRRQAHVVRTWPSSAG